MLPPAGGPMSVAKMNVVAAGIRSRGVYTYQDGKALAAAAGTNVDKAERKIVQELAKDYFAGKIRAGHGESIDLVRSIKTEPRTRWQVFKDEMHWALTIPFAP